MNGQSWDVLILCSLETLQAKYGLFVIIVWTHEVGIRRDALIRRYTSNKSSLGMIFINIPAKFTLLISNFRFLINTTPAENVF